MKIRKLSNPAIFLILYPAFFFALSVPAFADGSGKSNNSASPRSAPDREKKIYTNEDVEALAPHFERFAGSTPSSRTPSQQQSSAIRSAEGPLHSNSNLSLYAAQYNSLNAKIDAINAQVQQLRNFRNSGTAPSPGSPDVKIGLDIYAPCDGITTDNQIQQLLHERDELDAQISTLEDATRKSGVTLGAILEAAANPQTLQSSFSATSRDAQVKAVEQIGQLQSDLAQIQNIDAAMHQEAAKASMTLLPETNYGGGFTADYLKQLENQKATLQSQLSTMEDDARHIGIPPLLLP